MQIGTFDTTPFEVLEVLVADPSARRTPAPQKVCQNCILEFNKLGETPKEFSEEITKTPVLRSALADALRAAKCKASKPFKFKNDAQLFSEMRSVKNAIQRMHTGSAQDGDYDLFLSFWQTLKEAARQQQRVAA